MSSGDARERILIAASQEFVQEGFTGARVARIALAAHVNKQLIFYYFGSKAGLYRELGEWTAQRVARTHGPAEAEGEGAAGLRATIARLDDLLEREPALAAFLLDRGPPPPPRSPTGDDLEPGLAQDLLRDLTTAISRGQGLGHFRDDADPNLAAWQVLALCLGYRALRDRSAATVPTRDAWVDGVRTLVTRGLAW